MKKDTTRRNLILIIIALAITIVTLFAIIAFLVFGTSARVRRKITMAENYLEEFDYEQAESVYQDVLRIDSKNVEAYLGLIEIYTAQEDYDSALECAKEGYEESRDKRLKKLKEKIKEEMEETKESEEIEELEESKKEDIRGIEKTESEEGEDALIIESKSKVELSEFLSEILYYYLPDYTYEDVNYETLLYFTNSILYHSDKYETVYVDGEYKRVFPVDDINEILIQYFDITVPLQTFGEIEYKNGCFYFLAGDAECLGEYIAVIEDVKQDGNYYTVVFYDTYVAPEDFETGMGNPTSTAEYYEYSLQDLYNDKFCSVRGKVTCVLEEKDGRLIIKKYNVDRSIQKP